MTLRDLAWRLIEAVPITCWGHLTWLGDSGLLLPVAALIGVWLLASPRTRTVGLMWLLLFGIGGGLVAATKIAFMGWNIGSLRWNFTGLSGHTALSASIWPVVLWLVFARAPHALRVVLVAAGWLLAALIGVSRLALISHSVSEVVSGYVVGVAVSAAFLMWQHPRPHPRFHWSLVSLSLLTPLLFFHPGQAANTQGLLERIAIRLAGIERPYERADLK